jgi:hypothetical protein
MRKRMLHENICESEKIQQLSPGAEVMYYRILTKVDDYGNWWWEVPRFKSNCFSQKHTLTNKVVINWMQELVDAKLVTVYQSECRNYFHFNDFENYQKLVSNKRRNDVPIFQSIGCSRADAIDSDKGFGQMLSIVGDDLGVCSTSIPSQLALESTKSPSKRSKEEGEEEVNNQTPTASLTFIQNKSQGQPPEPEYVAREYSGTVIALNKDNSDGVQYNSDTVRKAIVWAYEKDDNQFWVPRIQTLAGLRKCITSMVSQMGNWTPPAPKPPLPTEPGSYQLKPSPNCTLCHTGKIWDRAGLMSWCSCNTRVWVSDKELYGF